MKWIKVEDRLPEVDVNVIALTSKGKVMVTSMYIPKDCRGKVLGKAEWHGSSAKPCMRPALFNDSRYMSIENFFFRNAVASTRITEMKYKLLYGEDRKSNNQENDKQKNPQALCNR